MKKIGVVVPVYNTEKFLKKCIESILKQSYKNIEIMLVDDGSVDDSGMICDAYAKHDNRVRVIHHEKNMGLIMARYNGAINLNSDCDYITFIDSDDWINLNTYNLMKKYMDDDYDIIMFQIIRYFDENNLVYVPMNFFKGSYNKEEINKTICPKMIWNIDKDNFGIDPSVCSKLIKRDKLLYELEKIKKIKIYYGEDAALIYPLIQNANSLIITDEYLYYHRQRQRKQIAPYIIDENYYQNVFTLYDYLKSRMKCDKQIYKQLDYHYVYSVGLRLRIYGDRKSRRGYVFPFDIVSAESKIIIYGASEVGQLFYQQVVRINYCEIVAWVDKNYLNYQELGVKKIETVETCIDYDYIIVAIAQENIAKNAIFDLIDMGVNEKKIIWSVR